ncbi:MAG: UDP-N-acetylmuramate--L-alanine ligase [Crocinitomicaceae bacterium]
MSSKKQHINSFSQAYFIGIGGIGMSALARYFLSKGWKVGGYDKTPSKLTETLEKEGATVHFEDLGGQIPDAYLSKQNTLVIYTPAIPKTMKELLFLQENDFTVMKRSEVLGMITRDSKALCVAGTHGKTTTSALLAHVLNESSLKCSAFLGGISTNFNSNFIGNTDSDLTVIEADEFDRSFLRLNPFASIVTTTDADHLDIYNDDASFQQSFQDYADLIDDTGYLVHHFKVNLNHSNSISYGMNFDADYKGSNERFVDGVYLIDVESPEFQWKDVVLGLPGTHNAENALACIALLAQLGMKEKEIRHGLASFLGVKRRFEFQIRTSELVFIDDYAHHPTEIEALINAVKALYPAKRITGIFQPHLFSRTRDFFNGFATQLSRLDEVVLLPIYPAREEPIEGVTSDALLNKITTFKKKLIPEIEVVAYVASQKCEVVLTIGAGDIDRIIEPLKITLEKR